MATFTIGSGGIATISAALASGSVHSGDTLALLPGYNTETASVGIENLTFSGDASNIGIALTLSGGITAVTLTGTAPIAVTGNESANSITGNDGSNVLVGSLGNDSINGGAGADTIHYVVGEGYYQVGTGGSPAGGAFPAAAENPGPPPPPPFPGDGIDTIDGGADHDTLRLFGTDQYVDDWGKGYGGDNYLNVVVVDGVIASIEGGTVANVESVVLDLGEGEYWPVVDALDYAGTTGAVTVNLATGTGTGFTSIAGVENVFGGSGNDVLTGDAEPNSLAGGAGLDSLDGGAGNDFLEGGGGGNGDQDILTGGLGADTFGFNFTADSIVGNPDVITDWESSDIIDLAAIDANTSVDGNQYFTFLGLGAADLTVGQGELKYYHSGGNTFVVGNVTADNQADFQIQINGLHNLTADQIQGVVNIKVVGGGSLAANEANEFAGNGMLVGTVAFQNPDSTALTYSLVDNAGGRFTINASTGAITVANALLLDFEQNPTHVIRVRVEDQALGAFEKDFTVTINNVDPERIIGDATANTFVGGSLNDVLRGAEGSDVLLGGAGEDWLSGNGDQDVLTGGLGADVLSGGAEADTFVFTSTADSVLGAPDDPWYPYEDVITDWESSDIIDLAAIDANTSISGNQDFTFLGLGTADLTVGQGELKYYHSGGTFVVGNVTADNQADFQIQINGLHNLTADQILGLANAVLTGTIDDDILIGTSGNDILTGGEGDDLLEGRAGGDAMTGGAGNDVYVVDNVGDVVIERATEGIDTVNATVHYRLTSDVERLALLGSSDLQAYGNELSNSISGNSGRNILNGDAGADVMYGLAGDDAYFVDNAGDQVVENAGEGQDAVFSTAHFALSANVETLVLQGMADLQGYGNSLTNALYGNGGNNLLNGNGGADAMLGGIGNDVYFVDDAGDQVVENAGEGQDAVFSAAHFGLSANVETLVLQGNADLQGYGNSLTNKLYGNGGNNLLNGNGGADAMLGGIGNDVYFVDDAGDLVFENLNEGTDAVFATVAQTLSANVETLVLQGLGDLNGTGNGLNNKLFGNAGANTLDGRGGADLLTGNAGNDTFAFHMGQGDGDTVVDFAGNGAAAGDSLQFVGYGAGATFTWKDDTHWQVNFNGGASHEIITFMNGASIDESDFLFV